MSEITVEQLASLIATNESLSVATANKFAYALFRKCAELIKVKLDLGVTDEQVIAEELFNGWKEVCSDIFGQELALHQFRVQNSNDIPFQAVKTACKRIMNTTYDQLPEERKEKFTNQASGILYMMNSVL